jgi:hypothetical protein
VPAAWSAAAAAAAGLRAAAAAADAVLLRLLAGPSAPEGGRLLLAAAGGPCITPQNMSTNRCLSEAKHSSVAQIAAAASAYTTAGLGPGCAAPPPMRQLHAFCCQRQGMLDYLLLSLLSPARGCPRAGVAWAACGLAWEGVLH